MMKKKHIKKFVIVFALLNLVGMGGIILLVIDSCNLTESNTVEYCATVKDVFVKELDNKTTITITTEEHGNSWRILNQISKHLGNSVEKINTGQKITVRISDDKTEIINSGFFIDIVSLKVENEDIFTLEEYNSYMQQAWTMPIIAGIVFMFGIAGALVYLVFRGKKTRGQGDGLRELF